MARERKTSGRKPKTRILILCEGDQSEPNYFKGIKQFEREGLRNIALEVEIGKTEKNTPFELVQEIVKKQKDEKKKRNAYDELWVVFDKDGHPKMNETFQAAKKEGVKIAFSSISFEFWILLHFEKTTKAFSKCDQLITYIESQNHMKEYEKNLTDVYNKTKDKLEIAFHNAEFVRNQMKTANSGANVFTLNTYTNVDDLVKRLLNKERPYVFKDGFKI
jgi:hypothetical protein